MFAKSSGTAVTSVTERSPKKLEVCLCTKQNNKMAGLKQNDLMTQFFLNELDQKVL